MAVPAAYRVSSFGSNFKEEWELWLISVLCFFLMGSFFILLATRELMLGEVDVEPERYARIEVGGGAPDLPAGEPAAAAGKAEVPDKVLSPRKVAERAEVAAVNRVQAARDRALQQSVVGVIASRSKVGNSALSRVLDNSGIGSEVEEVLEKVDRKAGSIVGPRNRGGDMVARGGTGGSGKGGAGGLGLGGVGGIGTGYGGGGGGVALGVKASQKVTASLTKGAASIEGSLDASLIDQVVRKNLSGLKYCYEKELDQNPKLSGKIIVQFVIGLSGEVTDSSVESSTMNNPTVEDCLLRRVRRWRFPRPEGGSVVVSYPFVFTSAS